MKLNDLLDKIHALQNYVKSKKTGRAKLIMDLYNIGECRWVFDYVIIESEGIKSDNIKIHSGELKLNFDLNKHKTLFIGVLGFDFKDNGKRWTKEVSNY